MEKLSNHISDKLSRELNFNDEKRAILAYGAFAVLQTIEAILLVFVFGTIFNVTIEALIVSFTISILRKYSGGVHSSSSSNCVFLGTVIAIGQALIFTSILIKLDIQVIIILGIILFTWAYFLIFRLAPVGSITKPIKKEAQRKRLKKLSIIILSVYLVIVIVCLIFYVISKQMNLLIYILCIYGGFVWQVFTLTKSGHFILTKIDIFLNQLKNREE